ncbi:MAG: glycosyltransferase family 2 protein [Chloroflexi bacterium]|nr:glycosyltransferase family 2 protein [Chloroflexota bacterium]
MTETIRREIRAVAIIVPVYNEAGVVTSFHKSLATVLDALPQRFTILYVDDGSRDGTPQELASLAAADPRVGVATLSRNFGHQAALSAGLDLADADAVICMDGDGQNPPEEIPGMLGLAETGYDLVQMQRGKHARQGWFKDLSSALFYWLINKVSGTPIAPGVADFRLLTRPAVEALRKMPEYHRFLRGMTAWIGFPSIIRSYTMPERLGGRSKYSLRLMSRLAADALFSFTLRPLYLMVGMGAAFLLFAFLELAYVLSFWLRGLGHTLAPGWSSLMFVILFVGGSTLASLGIVGIYIGYIFQEIKGRPVYVLRHYHKPGEKPD